MRLRGYDGPIRQIAVTGLGRERPTLFLSNDFEETPRELIIRYAGRNRVEGGLGVSVNFFHLDCLASEVRLNVDLDAALTVIANGCYRWLAIAAQRVREGRPEATVPPVRRDGRDGDDPARPPDRRASTAGATTRSSARRRWTATRSPSRGSASGGSCSPTADPDSRPRIDYFPGRRKSAFKRRISSPAVRLPESSIVSWILDKNVLTLCDDGLVKTLPQR